MEVLHRTSKWGEVRRLACPLRRFPFAAPPNCGGKVVAPATKGGMHFQRPQGGCKGFSRQRRYKKWRRRRRTSPAQRYYITPEGGALNPSGRRQPVPDRTLGAQGRQARRRHQPSRRSRVNLREYRKAPPRSRSRPRRRAPEPSSPTGRSPQRWEKISSAPVSSSTSRSQCLFSASFLILSASFGTITLSV